MSDKEFLVIGLGNIGAEYSGTRHNMGFMVLDAWAQASNTVFETKRYADVCTVGEKGRKFHLIKPSTYMNLSGNAVRYWMQQLDIPVERIVIICDDLNLPFETLRMRGSGSDGGHNGLKNITELIGTEGYARIRMGIGNEFAKGGQVDFVLGTLSEEQKEKMKELCPKVIQGIKDWAFVGIQKAMTNLNTKK